MLPDGLGGKGRISCEPSGKANASAKMKLTKLLYSFLRVARILLAGVVVALALLRQQFFVSRSQVWTVDVNGQLVQLAVELERHLVILIVHRRSRVHADVKGFVPLQNDGNRVFH